MERVKKLEKQHGRIPRYMGNGMYEKYGSELERPYPSLKGKKKAQFMGRFLTSFMFAERVRVRECYED